MPGNIAGSCRRTRAALITRARRRRGDRRQARRDVRLRQFEARLQPCRGYRRADRPVYPRQRAEPPRRLSLQLCRRAVADAGAAQADRRQPVSSRRRTASPGNDDLGQMSAWLVFTALGFYPVTPGSLEYVIGRPFVDRAALSLPERQAVHHRRGRTRRPPSVRRLGQPERRCRHARLSAPRRDHGRRRAAVRHAVDTEQSVGG